MRDGHRDSDRGLIVITGGAGFIGCNLAYNFLCSGWRVLLLDNLSRNGVDQNVRWLQESHGDRVQLVTVDVRDACALRDCLACAEELSPDGIAGVFHFAAQVAVTASLVDPLHDFEVNAFGTLNVLQAIRILRTPPPLVYTSTNKVYGCLPGLVTRRTAYRYEPLDAASAAYGISESQPLDFQSPYGCSKGTADQYVLDYARNYGIKATVFRMSCIYGPHQFGTEDQGWIAHFLLRALDNEPITIYGDGCQVRDALYVDDLVRAFRLAWKALRAEAEQDGAVPARHPVSGQAFNIGGGPQQAISLLELIETIGALRGHPTLTRLDAWRTGDQRYYVSDTRRFRQAVGWVPQIGLTEGIARLHAWLSQERRRFGSRAATAGVIRRFATNVAASAVGALRSPLTEAGEADVAPLETVGGACFLGGIETPL